jgi:hypothetical protein
MKPALSSFLLFLIALFSYGTASAQSVNVKTISVTDIGTQLKVVFDVAGLGNVSSTPATVTFDATLKTECQTPSGKNSPPGQDQTITGATQTEEIPVRNGRARATLFIPKEDFTVTNVDAGCPNDKFTPVVTDAIFTNVVVTVAGEEIFNGDPASVTP